MNPTTHGGESIISTLPSSILRERLKTHGTDYLLYVERLPEALQIKRDLEVEEFPDQKSIDSASERYRIWLLHIEGYTLLVDLCDKIDTNPFPGMQVKVTKVAVRLSPEVGRSRWLSIFELYDIDASWRLYFPAEVVEFDVAALESELLKLAGERDSVPIAETREVIPWVPTSKAYQTAKRALEERGWQWKNVKREGKQGKAIVVPSGYRRSAENSAKMILKRAGE
jgi:hypothetical protein